MIQKSYSFVLVILSVVVALIGAYVAVEIAQRTHASEGRRRIAWSCAGTLVLGLGIWSMHCVGMLALNLPMLVWYDALALFASIVAAVGGCAIAFIIFNRAKVGWPLLALASVFVGAAMAGMHYTGMAGMQMSGQIIYDPLLVAASVGVGIVLSFAERDGTITYFNPYWYEYTGLSQRQTLGNRWTGAIHPEDRDRVVGTWQSAVREGRDYEIELRLRHKNGTYCWFLARGRPGRDEAGNIDAWMGIAVDIEERKRAEQEAWAASQAKSEFLASMSHELRTPLNAIGGYAELLAMGVRGPLNAEQAQDIARIRRSQQHLLTPLNAVLNFAKVDAGQAEYHITAVPVDEALKDTESMIAPQILAKGLHYSRKCADKSNAVLAVPEKLLLIV